jgi:hypothetical protein
LYSCFKKRSTFAPNGEYFAVAAWTGDVRIWEIKGRKENPTEFEKVIRAMELRGHKVWQME